MKSLLIVATLLTLNTVHASDLVGTYTCQLDEWGSERTEITIDKNLNLFDLFGGASYDRKDEFGWWSGMREHIRGFGREQRVYKLKHEQTTQIINETTLRAVQISSSATGKNPEVEIEVREFELTGPNRGKLIVTPLPWDHRADSKTFDCVKRS